MPRISSGRNAWIYHWVETIRRIVHVRTGSQSRQRPLPVSRLFARLCICQHERHPDGQKVTRSKTAGQNQKASTTSIEILVTPIDTIAVSGRYAVWRRT